MIIIDLLTALVLSDHVVLLLLPMTGHHLLLLPLVSIELSRSLTRQQGYRAVNSLV